MAEPADETAASLRAATSGLAALITHSLGEGTPLVPCSKTTLLHTIHVINGFLQRSDDAALALVYSTQAEQWHHDPQEYSTSQPTPPPTFIFASDTPMKRLVVHHLSAPSSDQPEPLQECFVAVRAPRLSFALCGQRRAEAPADDLLQFAFTWSFAPEIVHQMVAVLTSAEGPLGPTDQAMVQRDWQEAPGGHTEAETINEFMRQIISFQEGRINSILDQRRATQTQMRWHTELTTTLVHDLRTPLQSINLMLEMLDIDSTASGSDYQLMIDMAIQSATGMDMLVQTLLDMHRLEAESYVVQLQPINLRVLLREAVMSFMPLFEHSQLILIVAFADLANPPLGDATLLAQVLHNLIDYALRLTPSGGTITLGSKLGQQDDQAAIYIRTSGRGIAPELLPHLFERHRQHSTKDRRVGGLELYFCRLAMAAQHGSIQAASSPGLGVTITLSLPIQRLGDFYI